MSFLRKSETKLSSRRQIQIKEVRDGILILPNDNYSLVIETSSINFELKSEDEQDVLIDNFGNFLNSLVSPIQIVVRIREVEIDRYLDEISKIKNIEKEEVYKRQIENYSDFVKGLISGNKILTRKFYVVISYREIQKEKDFNVIKEQINLNKDIVIKGLEKLGMKADVLNSLEVLDLFYSFYNPISSKIQKLKNQTVDTFLKEIYVN